MHNPEPIISKLLTDEWNAFENEAIQTLCTSHDIIAQVRGKWEDNFNATICTIEKLASPHDADPQNVFWAVKDFWFDICEKSHKEIKMEKEWLLSHIPEWIHFNNPKDTYLEFYHGCIRKIEELREKVSSSLQNSNSFSKLSRTGPIPDLQNDISDAARLFVWCEHCRSLLNDKTYSSKIKSHRKTIEKTKNKKNLLDYFFTTLDVSSKIASICSCIYVPIGIVWLLRCFGFL